MIKKSDVLPKKKKKWKESHEQKSFQLRFSQTAAKLYRPWVCCCYRDETTRVVDVFHQTRPSIMLFQRQDEPGVFHQSKPPITLFQKCRHLL
jgi:hypothetical protein